MAIQLDLTTSNYGIPFQAAYFRVVTASVLKQRESRFSVTIDVVAYATKPTNEDIRDIDFRRYHAPLDEVEAQIGTVFLEKVYNWISVQEDMVGSIGV